MVLRDITLEYLPPSVKAPFKYECKKGVKQVKLLSQSEPTALRATLGTDGGWTGKTLFCWVPVP
jgi:hypothetical protein